DVPVAVSVVPEARLDALDLCLEAVGGDVDGGEVIDALAVRTQRLARRLHRHVDAVSVAAAGRALSAELDFHLDDAVEETFDARELVGGVLPEPVVEVEPSPRQVQVH